MWNSQFSVMIYYATNQFCLIQIFDHQHHMGLIIMEKKRLDSEYEKLKASSETAELRYNREQAANASALAEARKREDRLKKAVGVKEECIASVR